MESQELRPGTLVLSRSPLHDYITGPVRSEPKAKSNFNPYRKKSGFLAFLGLEEVDELLRESGEPGKSQENSEV